MVCCFGVSVFSGSVPSGRVRRLYDARRKELCILRDLFNGGDSRLLYPGTAVDAMMSSRLVILERKQCVHEPRRYLSVLSSGQGKMPAESCPCSFM